MAAGMLGSIHVQVGRLAAWNCSDSGIVIWDSLAILMGQHLHGVWMIEPHPKGEGFNC